MGSKTHNNKNHQKRGTALVMAILISVVLTGLVICLSLVTGTQNLAAANTIRRNSAFYAAQAGAQKAYWDFKNNTAYRASASSPLTGTLTMGTGVYTYSVTCIGSGNTVAIVSVATLTTINGSAVSGPTIGSTYQLSAVSNSYIPALQTNNVLDMTKATGPLTITGDVMVQKDLNANPKLALTVNGNVTYGGKLGAGDFTYTGTLTNATPTAVPTPNYTTIEAHAYNPAGTAGTPNMTIDFTKISGANPTYYVTGMLTDPIIVGSGTVVVDGKGAGVTFDTSTILIGSSSAPVYIVCSSQGVIQIGDPKGATTSCTIYGGIYAGKDFNTSCQTIIYGPVEIIGNPGMNGGTTTSSITTGTAAWFDTTTPTSAGAVTSSNIGGAVP